MPSFLSRVFGGKKDDDKKERRLSAPSALLEGKFEAVSPSVSPSAHNFTVSLPEKERDKGLLRTFSRVHDKDKDKPTDLPPHLSLNLSDTRNLATLDEVFRGAVLSDDELRDKTLSVDDCLALVKVCAAVIALHGLETPGIMHPHWHSSSPETQRRLLSSFFSSPDWQTNFKHESNMHDIAAVFRWAFRHLSLHSSFGNAQDWYTSFSTTERQKLYPETAYSSILRPVIPDTNMELLQVTLNLFSSLASHAERNASSASKLSKVIGFWLLDTQTPQGTWEEFYSRWERSGRILEHLFLASIRDEAASSSYPMPKRLIELVKGYPYAKEETNDDLLPKPRFSTRKCTALYVNLTTEFSSSPPASDTALTRKKKSKAKATSLPESKKKEVYDALGILTEALTTTNSITSSDGELWNTLRSSYSSSLGSLFADETVRLLTLASPSAAPGAAVAAPKEPTFIYTPSEEGGSHRRSFSLDTPPRQPSSRIGTNGTNSPTSGIGVDWTQFSTSGFLDSPVAGTGLAGTLLDGDIEVTTPTPSQKASKTKRASSKTRRSIDVPPISTSLGLVPPEEEKQKKKSAIKEVKRIEIDESFVDFFADSLTDRRSQMVQFVIAKLRSEVVKSDVEWVVVERRFGDVSKPKATEEEQTEPGKASPRKEKEEKRFKDVIQLKTPTKRTEKEKEKTSPTTPKPLDAILSSTKKRFTFFAPSKSSKEYTKEPSEKKRDNVRVGEMGEILKEEDESGKKETKDAAFGSAAVVAAAAAATVAPEVIGDATTKAENGVVDQTPAKASTEPLATKAVETKDENGVVEHYIEATSEPAVKETVQVKSENGVAGHEEKAITEPEIRLVPTTEVKVPQAEVIDGIPLSPKIEEVVQGVVGSEGQVPEPQAESSSQPQIEGLEAQPQPEVEPEVPARVEPEPEASVPEVAAPEPEPEVQAPAEFEHEEAAATQPEPEPEAEAPVVEHETPTETEPEVAEEHVEEAEPKPEPEVEVPVTEPEPHVVEPAFNGKVPSHVEPEPEAESEAPPAPVVDVPVESEPVAELESKESVPDPEPEEEAEIEVPVPVMEPIRDPSPGQYEEETVSLDPVPTVEAEPIPVPESAVGIPPEDPESSLEEEKPQVEEEPAAPKGEPQSVLLSGSTPGPEIALSASESTATHEA